MSRRISCRVALTALAAVVTFVAMADTSEAFWLRRRAVYNNGYSSGCGCSSCGCAAVTTAPACGCTTATGTYDQAFNNGYNEQAPYAQQQQGYLEQGAPIQQGTPYQARRENFRGGEIQSGNLPSVRERSQMQNERSEMRSERSESGSSSQQNQQNRSSNRSNDRSAPPPPPET